MNNLLFDWIAAHEHKIVSSPRARGKDFEIMSLNKEKRVVNIRFADRKYNALPLTFEMFDRALSLLTEKKGDWVRVGASVADQVPGTIEGEIWKKPFPIDYSTPFKASSHICDFLVSAGLVEYGKIINPFSRRRVQAVRLI